MSIRETEGFVLLCFYFFKSSVGGVVNVRHILSTKTNLIETTILLIEESGVLDPFYFIAAGSIFASKVLAMGESCAELAPLSTDPETKSRAFHLATAEWV